SSGIANGYAYVNASAGLCRSSCLMRLRPRPHPQSGECVHGSAPLLPLAPVVACPAPPAVRVTLSATAVTTERRRRFMATSGSGECNVVPEERADMKSFSYVTRRQALEAFTMTAAATALRASAFAQTDAGPTTFPKGAIIRTILKDYAPEELAGGATLFH